jgi:hypothetical protein
MVGTADNRDSRFGIFAMFDGDNGRYTEINYAQSNNGAGREGGLYAV